jgi:hypothetical protein
MGFLLPFPLELTPALVYRLTRNLRRYTRHMQSAHGHPSPNLYRWTQYSIGLLMLLIVLSFPLQLLLGILIPTAPLFFITAFLTLLLLLPLLLQSAATPPVVISDSGITLQPLLWKERFIAWEAIQAMKPYPLLPPHDSESMRKAMVGRKSYRAAEGMMLLVPGLPLPYRATSFFVGEKTPVVALTNRTHQHYDHLVKQIQRHLRNGDIDES